LLGEKLSRLVPSNDSGLLSLQSFSESKTIAGFGLLDRQLFSFALAPGPSVGQYKYLGPLEGTGHLTGVAVRSFEQSARVHLERV
jgi:hypothetical protein